MSKEFYKVIPGFPNYEVSDLGNVRNKKTGKVLKPYLTRGYLRVSLYDDEGKRCCKLLHRIAAEAFIPNPEKLPVVNHINGCKTDARVTNLEWVTHSENMSHAHRSKLRPKTDSKGENNGFAKLSEIEAREIKRHAIAGMMTQNEIAVLYNVSRSTVKDIKSGRRWEHIKIS